MQCELFLCSSGSLCIFSCSWVHFYGFRWVILASSLLWGKNLVFGRVSDTLPDSQTRLSLPMDNCISMKQNNRFKCLQQTTKSTPFLAAYSKSFTPVLHSFQIFEILIVSVGNIWIGDILMLFFVKTLTHNWLVFPVSITKIFFSSNWWIFFVK